jgi:hypothetical protein
MLFALVVLLVTYSTGAILFFVRAREIALSLGDEDGAQEVLEVNLPLRVVITFAVRPLCSVLLAIAWPPLTLIYWFCFREIRRERGRERSSSNNTYD